MARPHAGDGGTNGRASRARPRTPQQRSKNRLPYPDERLRADEPEPPDERQRPVNPADEAAAGEPVAEEAADRDAEAQARRAANPPLDVVLEMTRGDGPIAGSARALGIALLASAALVLAGLTALVVWALKAIF